MLKFYKGVNEFELLLGVYISSTNLDKQALIIVQYFLKLFTQKEVKSQLASPIMLLFDPTLNKNKLEIKVSRFERHAILLTLILRNFFFIDSDNSFFLLE